MSYAECRYAECRYAECRYAQCRYDECRHAECRSALKTAKSVEKFAIKCQQLCGQCCKNVTVVSLSNVFHTTLLF